MCLVLFSFEPPTDHKFVLFANRDEFYQRPARAMDWWKEDPTILAGQDIEAGGMWLGISKDGRFGALTNFRESSLGKNKFISRGWLIKSYLEQERLDAQTFFSQFNGDDFAGFSLLLGDNRGVHYLSNRSSRNENLTKGTHVLANRLLNSRSSKAGVVSNDFEQERINFKSSSDYLKFLTDQSGGLNKLEDKLIIKEEDELPYRFIKSDTYGTRCSTILTIGPTGIYKVLEQRYGVKGKKEGASTFSFFPE